MATKQQECKPETNYPTQPTDGLNRPEIVGLNPEEMRFKVPGELYAEFLIWAGLQGMSKAEAGQYSITFLLNSPGVSESIQRRLKEKSELHGVSIVQIKTAIWEYFRRLARQSRTKLRGAEVKQETEASVQQTQNREIGSIEPISLRAARRQTVETE